MLKCHNTWLRLTSTKLRRRSHTFGELRSDFVRLLSYFVRLRIPPRLRVRTTNPLPTSRLLLDPEGNALAHILCSITLSAPLFHKTIISLPRTWHNWTSRLLLFWQMTLRHARSYFVCIVSVRLIVLMTYPPFAYIRIAYLSVIPFLSFTLFVYTFPEPSLFDDTHIPICSITLYCTLFRIWLIRL